MLQQVVYPLHEACSKSKMETITSLLNTGPCTSTGLKPFDIDGNDFEGLTPLHAAIIDSQLHVVRKLLAARSKIDVKAWNIALDQLRRHQAHSACAHVMKVLQQHAYPMHFACAKGCIEDVDRLLRQRVDVNATDWRGRTPLHEASKKGHVSVVQKLLSAGADWNAKDDKGFSVCHLAVISARLHGVSTTRDHEETFSMLQQAGASILEEMRSYGNLMMQEGDGHMQRMRQEKQDEEKYMDCLGGWGGFVWGSAPEFGIPSVDDQPRFSAQGSVNFSMLPLHATPVLQGTGLGTSLVPVDQPGGGTTQASDRSDSDSSSSSASSDEEEDLEHEDERLLGIWGRPEDDNYPEESESDSEDDDDDDDESD